MTESRWVIVWGWGGGGREKGGLHQVRRKLAGDGHVHYLDCGDSFIGVSRLTTFCTLNIYCLLYINYALIKLYKKMMLIKQKCRSYMHLRAPVIRHLVWGRRVKRRKSEYTNPGKALHYFVTFYSSSDLFFSLNFSNQFWNFKWSAYVDIILLARIPFSLLLYKF